MRSVHPGYPLGKGYPCLRHTPLLLTLRLTHLLVQTVTALTYQLGSPCSPAVLPFAPNHNAGIIVVNMSPYRRAREPHNLPIHNLLIHTLSVSLPPPHTHFAALRSPPLHSPTAHQGIMLVNMFPHRLAPEPHNLLIHTNKSLP